MNRQTRLITLLFILIKGSRCEKGEPTEIVCGPGEVYDVVINACSYCIQPRKECSKLLQGSDVFQNTTYYIYSRAPENCSAVPANSNYAAGLFIAGFGTGCVVSVIASIAFVKRIKIKSLMKALGSGKRGNNSRYTTVCQPSDDPTNQFPEMIENKKPVEGPDSGIATLESISSSNPRKNSSLSPKPSSVHQSTPDIQIDISAQKNNDYKAPFPLQKQHSRYRSVGSIVSNISLPRSLSVVSTQANNGLLSRGRSSTFDFDLDGSSGIEAEVHQPINGGGRAICDPESGKSFQTTGPDDTNLRNSTGHGIPKPNGLNVHEVFEYLMKNTEWLVGYTQLDVDKWKADIGRDRFDLDAAKEALLHYTGLPRENLYVCSEGSDHFEKQGAHAIIEENDTPHVPAASNGGNVTTGHNAASGQNVVQSAATGGNVSWNSAVVESVGQGSAAAGSVGQGSAAAGSVGQSTAAAGNVGQGAEAIESVGQGSGFLAVPRNDSSSSIGPSTLLHATLPTRHLSSSSSGSDDNLPYPTQRHSSSGSSSDEFEFRHRPPATSPQLRPSSAPVQSQIENSIQDILSVERKPPQRLALPVLSIGEGLFSQKEDGTYNKVTLGSFVKVTDKYMANGIFKIYATTACEKVVRKQPIYGYQNDNFYNVGHAEYVPTEGLPTLDMMLVWIDQTTVDVNASIFVKEMSDPVKLKIFETQLSDLAKETPVVKLDKNKIKGAPDGRMIYLDKKTTNYAKCACVTADTHQRISEGGDCGTLITSLAKDGNLSVYGVIYGKDAGFDPIIGKQVEFTVIYPFREAKEHLENKYNIKIELFNASTNEDSGFGSASGYQ